MEENNQSNQNVNEQNQVEPVVESTPEPTVESNATPSPVVEQPVTPPTVNAVPVQNPEPVAAPVSDPVAAPVSNPVATPNPDSPKKNTPIIIIILIIALCALVGLGVWYFGNQKAKEKEKPNSPEPTNKVEPTTPSEPTEPTEPTTPSEPTTPTEPTEPSEPTEPTTPSANKQKLSCEQKEDNYTMTLNFNYENKNLINGDALYIFDFSEYAKSPETFEAIKKTNMCDTVKSDPSVATIFANCKESWSNDGILTITFTISLESLSAEYNKLDINSLKTSFTNEGMSCTIK